MALTLSNFKDYPEVTKYLKNFFTDEKVKEAMENNDWDKFFDLKATTGWISLEVNGLVIDILLEAKIDFCNGLRIIPPYGFSYSNKLKKVDLRDAEKLGSRCFRKVDVGEISLSKHHLKDIDVGIISGNNNSIVHINWDGTYAEWQELQVNSNCWYNFKGTVMIHCTDGIFPENNTNI